LYHCEFREIYGIDLGINLFEMVRISLRNTEKFGSLNLNHLGIFGELKARGCLTGIFVSENEIERSRAET
jgi:hypothetical protein